MDVKKDFKELCIHFTTPGIIDFLACMIREASGTRSNAGVLPLLSSLFRRLQSSRYYLQRHYHCHREERIVFQFVGKAFWIFSKKKFE